MRIAITWGGVTGYMAACVRALAEREDVELRLVARQPGKTTPFDVERLLEGLDAHLFPWQQLFGNDVAWDVLSDFEPDVVVICGWLYRAYLRVLFAEPWREVPMIMTMDNVARPGFRGWMRQRLGQVALQRVFRRVSRWFVPGERSRHLLRSWRVPEAKIMRGLYAIDTTGLAEVAEARARAGSWPRRLLFVGQYIPRKGLETLFEAYARYRAEVGPEAAWSLSCCGRGPLAAEGPGIEDRGFVQPADLPAVLAESGALVLPSYEEHWGQVITEAACAGLPVVVSERCGAEVELVRDYVNGRTVPAGDPAALTRALLWLHERSDEALRQQGAIGRQLASPYDAQTWARQLHEAAAELLVQSRGRGQN